MEENKKIGLCDACNKIAEEKSLGSEWKEYYPWIHCHHNNCNCEPGRTNTLCPVHGSVSLMAASTEKCRYCENGTERVQFLDPGTGGICDFANYCPVCGKKYGTGRFGE
jgi:hypothetical protein